MEQYSWYLQEISESEMPYNTVREIVPEITYFYT